MRHTKFDGSAWISPAGKKYRVGVEALNFRGEVYITERQARVIRDDLDHALKSAAALRADKRRSALVAVEVDRLEREAQA